MGRQPELENAAGPDLAVSFNPTQPRQRKFYPERFAWLEGLQELADQSVQRLELPVAWRLGGSKMGKAILVVLFVVLAMDAHAQRIYDGSGRQVGRVEAERFYDGSGRQIGRVDAGRIYDGSGRQIGRVDAERIYDSSGRQIGRVDGDRLSDSSGRQLGRIDGERVYDASGRQIARTEGLRRSQIILFFYFYL